MKDKSQIMAVDDIVERKLAVALISFYGRALIMAVVMRHFLT